MYTPQDHEYYRETYAERVEAYRTNNDFMWRIFSGKEKEFLKGYLNDLCKYLRQQYGSPNSKRVLTPENLDVIEWTVNESDSIVMLHHILFFGLYLCPGFTHWVVNGDDKNPPPPLPNKQGFQYFVGTKLPKMCDELLSGKGGMDIPTFVRYVRAEYVMTVGTAEPPNQVRESFEKDYQLATQRDEHHGALVPVKREK